MKCAKCKTKAVIGLPRHNAAFCKPCFIGYAHEQVARAIKHERMFGKDDRILVAVSGGKDSLALWHMLLTMGYRADALYVDLGIPGYSARSREKVERFVDEERGSVPAFHFVLGRPDPIGGGNVRMRLGTFPGAGMLIETVGGEFGRVRHVATAAHVPLA